MTVDPPESPQPHDETPRAGCPAPLVGRDDELRALSAAVDAARDGSLRVVLIEGDPGMGKTALVRHVLQAAEPPPVVVWASGDEAEGDLDHGVIEQLVRAAPLDDRIREELAASVGGDPLRTGEVLVRLLDGFSINPDHPLVVVIDDIQWADGPSLRAITFAARRLRRDPVLLCLVQRTGEDTTVPSSLQRLVDDNGLRLRLGPLDATAARELAEAATGQAVSAVAAARLVAHTRGNPLHLRTLLEELPPSAVDAAGDLPAPRSFATLVLSRLAGCSPEAEALVTAVAVLGERTPLPAAATLAGLADPLPVLDEAVAAGLLAVGGGRFATGALVEVAMPHPLIRAAVLGDLSVARRAALHRGAGKVVDGIAGLRHRLLGATGPDGELWRDAAAAAGAEAARGAHSSAAALLQLAAGVATTAEEADVALLDATDQLVLAGRLTDAAARRGAVDAAAPSARRSYVQARLAYVVGPRRDARRHLQAAWEALGADAGTGRDAPLAGRIAGMLAMISVDRAQGAAAIEWGRRAMALAPAQAALLSTGHMVAAGHALAGTLAEGIAEFDEVCSELERAGGAAHEPAVVDAHCARGLLRLWSHDLPGAVEDLTASLDAAQRGASFAARESARFYLGEACYRIGRWDEAVHHAQLAASIVEDGEQAWMAALPNATAARPLAARGSPTADEHLERARRAAALADTGVGDFLSRLAAIEVAVSQRDDATAVAIGDEVRAAGGSLLDERVAPWRIGYVDALVAVGRIDDAAAIATELACAPSTPLVDNDAAMAALLVAAARGDTAVADAAAEAGLRLDPDAVGPYPRARLELAAGRMWRRRGERRKAITVLEAAMARFQVLGAEPWLVQVEREIAAAGLRPAARQARSGQELTPREEAVALLVAQGLTNSEVAGELILSAKTVEHHLSRIYAKLGVRSRTELAARLHPGV